MWAQISKSQPENVKNFEDAEAVVQEIEKIFKGNYGWPTSKVKYSNNLKQTINS